MQTDFFTGSALVALDVDSRVVAWNRAAEELTGIAAGEALGRRCWEVLTGTDDTGHPVCKPGCKLARAALEGRPVPSRDVLMKTATGRRRISLATVGVKQGETALCFHVLHAGRELTAPEASVVEGLENLTRRQRDVLDLLLDGVPAKLIAARLRLSEKTVRNYIREILLTLRCRSQLEALAKLRRLGADELASGLRTETIDEERALVASAA